MGKPDGHVLISTLGKLKTFFSGRVKVDLTALKMLIIDEADFFFAEDRDVKSL